MKDEPGPNSRRFSPVFYLESAAVMAFGLAWLIKGETGLKGRTI